MAAAIDINDFACFFIPDKACFGAFPTDQKIQLLHSLGINLVIDLTLPNENKCVPYNKISGIEYLHYPIDDKGIPKSKFDFAIFLHKIMIQLRDYGKKLYVHCKGGHGRSGLFAACLLCLMNGFSSYEAIKHVSLAHSKRKNMKKFWIRSGSPYLYNQKNFVYDIARDYHIFQYSNIFENESMLKNYLLNTFIGNIKGYKSDYLKSLREKYYKEYF